MRLLIINPGSTSTKISLYDDEELIFEESPFHDAPTLLKFPTINAQLPYRLSIIMDMLKRHNIDPSTIDAYVGRGGSAHTQPSGVTLIDDQLYDDTVNAVGGTEHPARLGVMLAYELCRKFGGQMFTMNPTNVDELCDYARLTGIKGIYRHAQSHVLNQKAVAITQAGKLGKSYEDCNFIVCHIDGGITISAHEKGRMIDGNMGAGGEGAFTPTRLGTVPVNCILKYLEDHTVDELRILMSRGGGFVSHFGTSNSDTIHEMADGGDRYASLVWNTMIYQICKEIGAMSTVLKGHVDGIILTGGLLRFRDLVDTIRERCEWIAPISLYPGELEQEILCSETLKVLRGEKVALTYTGHDVWEGFSF